MAVEFISNGYDTTSTNSYTEGAWADAHPSIGLATYGVRSSTHWKVTAVAGADRTVSIAPGQGFGHGVTDKTYANDTIQLDAPSSGSRWDLIAVRRDWTPTAGVSKFVKVNGGATPVIPGGRLYGPGNIDDQPIALVRVTSGQTSPTAIIDLRTWSGDGGGLIAGNEDYPGGGDLIRSYMNAVGTRIFINGVDWIRRIGANDTPEWVKVSEIAKIPLFGVHGGLDGSLSTESGMASGQFLVQAGSSVGTSDGSGYGRITFPKPFPNGLLTVILTNGDQSIDRAVNRGTITMSVTGSPYTAGDRTSFAYTLALPTGQLANQRHRINWVAIGW